LLPRIIVLAVMLALRMGLRASDLKQMVHAYPTSTSDVSYMV